MKDDVVYEDGLVLLACKAAGEPVCPDKSGAHALQARLAAERGMCTEDLHPITRLDRPVGGLCLFAKTGQAAAALSQALGEQNRFCKEYAAVLCGVPDPPEGELRDYLYHDARSNKTYPVKSLRRGVKEAVLSYRTVESREGLTLVRVRIFTGRTHQIRVQFASRKWPLYGDGKYGARAGQGAAREVALYACALVFLHPKTGERMAFSLPLPACAPWSGFAKQE